MSKQAIEQQFARKVTKGMWIWPKKKREARQELLDHIEDVAEERNIQQWDWQNLENEIGSVKKLRKFYTKKGLPLWMRFSKWAIIVGSFPLALIIVMNFYILWFYEVPQDWLEKMKNDEQFLDEVRGIMHLPEIDVRWQEPGDDVGRETYQRMIEANEILEEHKKVVEQARQDFIAARKEVLEASGFTEAEIEQKAIEFMQEEMSQMPGMMEMPNTMNPPLGSLHQSSIDNWILRKSGNPFDPPTISKEQLDRIWVLYTGVEPDDHLAFPRPVVTDEDIALLKNALDEGIQNLHRDEIFNLNRQWLTNLVGIKATNPPKEQYENLIQKAKNLFATMDFTLAFQQVSSFLSLNSESEGKEIEISKTNIPKVAEENIISKEQVPNIINSKAIWAKLFLQAINPKPEPVIGLLVGVAGVSSTFDMVSENTDSLQNLTTYKPAMQTIQNINFVGLIDSWEKYNSWYDQNEFSLIGSDVSVLSLITFFYSYTSIIDWQCDFMQLFISSGSDAFYQYEALKYFDEIALYATMTNVNYSSINNNYIRLKVAYAQTAVSQGALNLLDWLDNQNPIEDFTIEVQDPFSEKGIQFDYDAETFTFSSAGPDEVFGGPLYNPSNGTTSAGDIRLSVRR